MKNLICLILALALLLAACGGCSKPAGDLSSGGGSESISTESESTSGESGENQAESSSDDSAIIANKDIETDLDYSAVLKEFSNSLLVGSFWADLKELPVANLVMWYGYKILERPGGASDYLKDGLDGLFIPSEEFEEEIFKHFGLEASYLEEDENFSSKYSCFVTPAALYPVNHIKTEVLDVSSENGIYLISLKLLFDDGGSESCILSVKKTDENSYQFLSYLPANQ